MKRLSDYRKTPIHLYYTYDRLGRLAAADFSRRMPSGATAENGDPDADFSTAYTYDLQGNMLSLTRQGLIAPGLYGQIDDITASFSGNRLSELRDDAPTVLLEASLDLPEGAWSGSDFGYDANGNQTRDMSRGVSDVTYNVLNLPQRVEFADGGRIDYLYSASGTKLAETVYDAAGSLLSRRDYVGQFEFVADTLERTLLPEGFVTAGDNVFHAYIPDYQGNIVGVYNSSTNTLEQFTDYYPYGLPHASATAPTVNRRKYGAKELTTANGLNLYDFAARWHNPAFPAFTTPDPLAEKYHPVSPYLYCGGDPINLIDPTGMFSWGNFFKGLGEVICGVGEAVCGAVSISTGVGTPVGVAALLHGCDVISAGIMQMGSDDDVSTVTSQVIQTAGASKEIADGVDALISVGTTLGTSSAMRGTEAVASSVAKASETTEAAAATASTETKIATTEMQYSGIGSTGAYGEARLAAEYSGIPQQHFRTSCGSRFVDLYQIESGIAHESKVGRTSLTPFVRSQIQKDSYLLGTGIIEGVTWHFYTSPVTGVGGPTGPLRNELNRAGFEIVIHF